MAREEDENGVVGVFGSSPISPGP
ncbi:hypothetical protein CUMW_262460 [Citrus unshiu]|uniref:Uncharacterized protein n=1 Tax=Citrus unshiu TaxID=55188 RepID=A0A2H5QVB3_CITUN|nr:hypothetical protein CUMW_262460 [Citrus unshiu]